MHKVGRDKVVHFSICDPAPEMWKPYPIITDLFVHGSRGGESENECSLKYWCFAATHRRNLRFDSWSLCLVFLVIVFLIANLWVQAVCVALSRGWMQVAVFAICYRALFCVTESKQTVPQSEVRKHLIITQQGALTPHWESALMELDVIDSWWHLCTAK